MQVLYTTEYMATHSLTGAKSSTSRDKVVKPAMNQNEVQEIIGDNLIALIFTVFFSLKWLLNLGVVVILVISTLERWRWGDQEFDIILCA